MAVKCPKCHSDNTDTARFCSNCATSLTAAGKPGVSVTRTLETTADELVRGTLFAGRYEIIEELGTGGMGRVYRVHDTKLNEEVALKLIKPEIAAERRVVERFRNELKTARKIRHKNVCGMYDFHEEGKTLYLTMEYVRGEDLKSFIKRSKILSMGTALSIAHQVAEGLGEAHKLGITHRDLKPGNIMIDKEGQAKIMDFGIARSLAGGGTTAEGAIIGTPEYMSPEQVEGKEADQRADIYALGIILFEMVTGRLPFEGETPFSIANKQKSEPPPVPKKLVPQIPEDVSRLILRCLEKDKEKRFQTAAELQAQLENIEKNLPAAEKEEPRRKPFTSREITVQFSGKKVLMAAVGFVVLAAMITAAILLLKPVRPQAGPGIPAKAGASPWENSIAVLPLKNVSGDPQQDGFCYGMTEQITANLSQMATLKVIDSSSAMKINTAERTPPEIGKLLDVRYILEGSVQKSGDRIRITAKLVSAADGSLPWAKNYDRDLKDIFAVQDDISQEIGSALIQKLSPDDAREVKTHKSANSEAYVYYLQGSHLLNRFEHVPELEVFKNAEAMLKKCIEFDRGYAPAYAKLAYLYELYGAYHATTAEEKKLNLELVEELSRKATELGPGLPEVLYIEARVYSLNRQADELYKTTRRLLEGQPNDVRGNLLMGYTLRNHGLIYQSNPYFDKTGELDPLEPWSWTARGWNYWLLGNVDAAFAEYDKALRIEPDDSVTIRYYIRALLQMRKPDKAEPLLARFRLLRPDDKLADLESWLLALKGRGEEAVRYLEKNQGSPEARMVLDNLLGFRERVVDYFVDRAKKEAADYTISRYLHLQNHPFYDTVRNDVRFQHVIEQEKQKYPLVLKHYGFEK